MHQSLQRKSFMAPGELYFWTATINNWQNLMMRNSYKDVVISSLQYLSEQSKAEVYGLVVMPNHLHLIWRTLTMNGKESPQVSFLKFIAHAFQKMLREDYGEEGLASYKVDAANKQHEFWQRDSLAIPLFTKAVAFQKLDYLHRNPTVERWMLAMAPEDYYYSSAAFYETGQTPFLFLKNLHEEMFRR